MQSGTRQLHVRVDTWNVDWRRNVLDPVENACGFGEFATFDQAIGQRRRRGSRVCMPSHSVERRLSIHGGVGDVSTSEQDQRPHERRLGYRCAAVAGVCYHGIGGLMCLDQTAGM